VATILALVAVSGGLAWQRIAPQLAPTVAQSLTTATVDQRDLASKERVSGTLGYGDPSPLFNEYMPAAGDHGIVTALPPPGQVIGQGQPLYAVDGRPIVLLDGQVPLWRDLTVGISGPDVQELERDLLALGFATAGNLAVDGTFTVADAQAVKRWQASLGLPQTGVVHLGEVVIQPGSKRVYDLKAVLGTSLGPGAQVMEVTSATRQVTVQLDASLQSLVKVGDPVEITLPNSSTTTGKVAGISSVATTPASTGSSAPSTPQASTNPTVETVVALDNPAATGTLDQAPVTVSITSALVKNALAVPVDALLAQKTGGYAVQVVGDHGRTRLVPVRLGIFDDEDSLVQIIGGGVSAGTKVEVPEAL
jgi:peptidoglycan hydrolase-like protein with peptidoglycan-binding domain